MRRLLLPAVFLMLGFSSNAYSIQYTNGGFETGDASGWTTGLPTDGGSINVVAEWSRGEGSSISYSPVDGKYFAVLETGSPDGVFTTLSRKISLDAGESIDGWATFCCGDEVYYPYDAIDAMNYNDYANITILNSDGSIISTPWYADSYDWGYFVTDSDGVWTGEKVFNELSWEHWSWTATEPGTYTLQYGTTQRGDSEGNSYAFFDYSSAKNKSAAVPEPSAMVLLGMGLAGVAAANALRGARPVAPGQPA